MDDEIPTVVIDNGSGVCKAGFAGEEAPCSIIPTVIGYLDTKKAEGQNKADYYVGDGAWDNEKFLKLDFPIKHKIINCYYMEKIWHHIFYNELRVDPAEQAVLLTDGINNSKSSREGMCEIFFEVFNVPSFCVANQPNLSLYSSAHVTGTIVDIGYDCSEVVPIVESEIITDAITQVNYGGREITEYFQKILSAGGKNFMLKGNAAKSFRKEEIICDIKENHTYVAFNYNDEIEKYKNSSDFDIPYRLPDGSVTMISAERFRGPELLFKPYLNGLTAHRIDLAISDSIKLCNIDVRKTLYESIVLSGGSALFKGLPERLEYELKKNMPVTIKPNIIVSSGGNAAWFGGSIYASLATFPSCCVTRKEYNNVGSSIIHSKHQL